MHRLMLLRHAKSDWSKPGMPDRNRPLNKRGREAAPIVAAHIFSQDLVPQRALVSIATRTRETWKLMLPFFPRKPETIFEARLYESSPHTILAVIKETPASIKSLMIVGHNPSLQALAMALIGSGSAKARDDLAAKFPTAALAVIDFAAGPWSAVRPGTGRLEHFVRPRDLNGDDD
jgi:phosphohistidine phosphatase